MTVRSTATSNVCARNSRPWTASSRRSKLCMASAIDTATAEATSQQPEASIRAGSAAPSEPSAFLEPGPRRSEVDRRVAYRQWRPRWPLISPLTRRIVAVSVLPLALLALGFLYLGRFEASLIGQQIESLQMQGRIFAAALTEEAVLDSADKGVILLPELSRQKQVPGAVMLST